MFQELQAKKQCCNKFNKDFENGPDLKKKEL